MADSAVKMVKTGCQYITVVGGDFMSENERAILYQAGFLKVVFPSSFRVFLFHHFVSYKSNSKNSFQVNRVKSATRSTNILIEA